MGSQRCGRSSSIASAIRRLQEPLRESHRYDRRVAEAGRKQEGVTPWVVRAWAVVLAALTMLATLWVTRLPNIGGDTSQLLTGSDHIARCLHYGPRIGCGLSPDRTETLVGPFPLPQYIPDLMFKALGFTHNSRALGLSLISVAAFAAMLAVAYRTLRRIDQLGWWPIFLIVSVGSPLLYYANSTWGEMLGAFFLLAFTASTIVLDRPVTVGALAYAAALTKETAFPFVFAIGLIGLLLARRRSGTSIRAQLVAMVVGILAAVASAGLFNIFRFDSPLNEYYLQPKFHVTDLGQRAEYFADLLVAPNAGIILYWTSACAVLLMCTVLPFALLRGKGPGIPRWPALALGAILLGLTASLASWWMPFGWNAWGPRLTLPWIPTLIILAIAAYGEPARPVLAAALRSAAALAIVAALLVAIALPQFGYALAHPTLYALFFQPDTHCPATITVESIETQTGRDEYYSCIRYRAWQKSPILIDGLRVINSVGGAFVAAVWAVAVVALLYLSRLGLASARDAP
jgi:hypothetical protein